MNKYIKWISIFLFSIIIIVIIFFVSFLIQWNNVQINNSFINSNSDGDTYPYKNWMQNSKNRLKNKKLNEIRLIGSHNSASVSIDYSKDLGSYSNIRPFIDNISPLEKFINMWTINQSLDIYEQLCIGVRILHISTKYSDENMTINKDTNKDSEICYDKHSFALSKSVDTAKKILKFLDENPEEIVIIYFQNSDIGCIIEYIDILHQYINTSEYLTETYDNLVKNNNRCILIYTENITWFNVDSVYGLQEANKNNSKKAKYSFQTITPSVNLMATSKYSGGLYDFSKEIQKNYKKNINNTDTNTNTNTNDTNTNDTTNTDNTDDGIIWGIFDYVNQDLVELSINKNNSNNLLEDIFFDNPLILSIFELVFISIAIVVFLVILLYFFI